MPACAAANGQRGKTENEPPMPKKNGFSALGSLIFGADKDLPI